jgi:hypothetical protein
MDTAVSGEYNTQMDAICWVPRHRLLCNEAIFSALKRPQTLFQTVNKTFAE